MERLTLYICSLFSIFLFSMTKQTFPLLMPEMMQTMGLSYKNASSIFASMSIAGAASFFFIGYLMEKFNPKKLIFVFIALTIVAHLSFAGSVVYFSTIISGLMMGIGLSGIFLYANSMSPKIYPEKSANVVISVHFTYMLGAMLVPMFLPFIIKNIHWRYYLIILSSFYILLALIYSSKKANLGLVFQKNSESVNFKSIIATLKRIEVLYYCFVLFLYLCIELSIINWMVTFLKDGYNIEYGFASKFLMYFFVGMMVGRLLGSFISSYFNQFYMVLICLAISMTLFLIGFSTGNGYFLSACGFALAVVAPTIYNMFFSDVKENQVIAFGLMVSFSALGEAFSSTLIGIIADISSIITGFGFIIIFFILELALLLSRKKFLAR